MLFVRIVKAGGNVFKVQLLYSKIGYWKVNTTNIVVLKCNGIRTGDLQIALRNIYDGVALVDVCIIPNDVLRNDRSPAIGHTSPKCSRGTEIYSEY